MISDRIDLISEFRFPTCAKHSAREVSSVHCPGLSRKTPPPTIPRTSGKDPLSLNSEVVPTASPHASPTSEPTTRSRLFAMAYELRGAREERINCPAPLLLERHFSMRLARYFLGLRQPTSTI